MQITSIFKDAIALVRNPAAFMTANKFVSANLMNVIMYTAILAAIPLVFTILGDLWYYGGYYSFFGFGFATGYLVAIAIVTYILTVIEVIVIGVVIWKLAPNFASSTDQVTATRLAAYSYTPFFLASILDIVPFVGTWIALLGLLYGLYILYIGLPIMTNTPKDKALIYVVVTVVAVLIVYFVIGAIVGAITAAIFIRSFIP